MMPYLYSLAAMVHYNDYTMMRPLVMDFGTDTNVLNIGYQFMLGPSLMVNPVYVYGAREREVYFPKNNVWYDCRYCDRLHPFICRSSRGCRFLHFNR